MTDSPGPPPSTAERLNAAAGGHCPTVYDMSGRIRRAWHPCSPQVEPAGDYILCAVCNTKLDTTAEYDHNAEMAVYFLGKTQQPSSPPAPDWLEHDQEDKP